MKKMVKLNMLIAIVAIGTMNLNAQLKIVDGNVGIGITNPSYLFEVRKSQTGWLSRIYNTSNGARVYFSHNGGYGAYINAGNNTSSSKYVLQVTKDGVSSSLPYLYVNGIGNTGIGCKPSSEFKLDINGVVRATNFPTESDGRFKKDIKDYYTNTSELFQLRPVSYKWKKTEKKEIAEIAEPVLTDSINISAIVATTKGTIDHKTKFEKKYNRERVQTGFIAQELREIYPDLVYEDDKGYLSIDYMGLIPIMVDALKEQQTEIDKQKTKNSKQQKTIDEHHAALEDKQKQIDELYEMIKALKKE